MTSVVSDHAVKESFNICHEVLDRHLGTELENRVAISFVGANWPTHPADLREVTYVDLVKQTCQFAHALRQTGIKSGDVVFTLLPRIEELYVIALGTLRVGSIFSPLFSAFGPEPILTRIKKAQGKILFTLSSYYKKKIAPIRASLPDLKYVVLIEDDNEVIEGEGIIHFRQWVKAQDSNYILEKTNSTDPALLHFTSGTTGEPKGALHLHQAGRYHLSSGKFALDFKPDDLFWCTADPGWVTGTSYGIISPLGNGIKMLVDTAEFNPERWYKILTHFNVSNWYTAPTALRMLMKAGEELAHQYKFSSIRLASSVGEPLNPEVILWVKEHLGFEVHDNWWQTETGGIMIANYPGLSVRPGSMGKPLPGLEVALVKEHHSENVKLVEHSGEQGEIAIRKGWPSMFAGYLHNPEKYQKCFAGDWYLSGDIAKYDEDGYYWFIGRSDDVIKTSGHLIGPFEVENILMEHPAVLEAAAIGLPDKVAGEMIKGFVVLKKDFHPSDELKLDILGFGRKKMGVAVAPREIDFLDNLPKTRSGKIMRRLIKARQLGMPEGDLSTLEQSK